MTVRTISENLGAFHLPIWTVILQRYHTIVQLFFGYVQNVMSKFSTTGASFHAYAVKINQI